MFRLGIEWPFAVLDFEASALDPESYPIEIGISFWSGPVRPVYTWSSLIEPTPLWVKEGVWFEAAQNVHGISAQDLTGAASPQKVMTIANRFLQGIGSVVSDNLYWEALWLNKLAHQAGIKPDFKIDKISDRIARLPNANREKMVDYVKENRPPHRAGPDSLHLVKTLAYGLGYDPEIIEFTNSQNIGG